MQHMSHLDESDWTKHVKMVGQKEVENGHVPIHGPQTIIYIHGFVK